jgi:hypothetical protein
MSIEYGGTLLLGTIFSYSMLLINHSYALDRPLEQEKFSEEEFSQEYLVTALQETKLSPPEISHNSKKPKGKCHRRLDYGGPPITDEEVKAAVEKLLQINKQ